MRKIMIAAAILIVAAVGAVLFLVSNLDSLVKTAIETVGSKVAGVPVTVEAVKISLRNGSGTITGLSVANPPGFTTPTAITLGELSLAIDTASVTSNPVVIKDIVVAAPAVTYEIGKDGGSNITAIQNNVASYTAGGKAAPATQAGGNAAPASSATGGGKKRVIDVLELKDGKVTLATPLPGGKASAPLGNIRLTGIGSGGGGASGAQIATPVLQAVSAASIKAVGKLGIGSMVKGLTSGVTSGAGAGAAATGGLGQLKGLFGK